MKHLSCTIEILHFLEIHGNKQNKCLQQKLKHGQLTKCCFAITVILPLHENTCLNHLQWIYCIYALLLFIVIMFIAVPFIVLAVFLARVKGGNFIYKVCKVWGYIWYFLIGHQTQEFYEVPHDTSRSIYFCCQSHFLHGHSTCSYGF